jgi:hypothetical protein
MASRMQSSNVPTADPGQMAAAGPTQLNTTLYDVISGLQAALEPDKDNLVVAVIVHWLRSGRLTLARSLTAASQTGLTA